MELYNRTMTAEFAYKLLEHKKYVFLCSNIQAEETVERRGSCVKDYLTPSMYYEVKYLSNGMSREGKIQEGFSAVGNAGDSKEYSSLRKKDMYMFLEHLYSLSDILVVDFTLMNTRFLGAFVALLNMFCWKEVFFCYTEPGNYKRSKDAMFDLKNTSMGFDQIPNLETFSDSSSVCDWVVFLGFEGSRLMRLEEESPASRRYSLPHISIPAMRTNWHNIAMNENRTFFELKIGNQDKTEYVSAINPFETYQTLNNIRQNNSNVRLVISPIGPKPVMLGCIMYVLENENEMLLYDNPYQEGSNTDEYGKSHFYDLSQFVRTVKNRRYIEDEEAW